MCQSSKQSQSRQLLAQFCRQGSPARFTRGFITRDFIFSQIAPTLKSTAWLPLGRNDLGFENKVTAIDTLLIRKWTNIQQALTALDVALDNPVERATFQQLIDPFRNHSRCVKLFRHQTGRTLFSETEIDPSREIFDTVAADTKFDEIESHRGDLAKTNARFKPEASHSAQNCESTGDHVDGETTLTGFLVTLAHIVTGLAHCLDTSVERYKMLAVALDSK